MKNNFKRCQCVNTKIGTIAVKGGIKPIFIMELAMDDGEVLIKFFNVNKTQKGNLTVPRNGDFARLYRLTIGENPAARFSRADRLLGHFVGHCFDVEYLPALDKRNGEYLKVTSICPSELVLSDEWTQTGHLIKSVRAKNKNLAKNCQRFGNKLAINWQNSGNCNQAQGQTTKELELDLNPIQHPPSQIGTYNIDINKDISYIERRKTQKRPPPKDLDQSLGKVINQTIH